MSANQSRPHAAYIEDYNEDANTALPETRQTANIAAKRSKPEIARVKVTELGREEASDSGYSSHTAATLNSKDSSLASKAGSATLTLDTSLESLSAGKRRPLVAEKLPQNAPQSPQKPSLRRTGSKARQKETTGQGRCRCEECQAKTAAKAGRRKPPPQISTVREATQAKPQPSSSPDNAPVTKDPRPAALRVTTNAPTIQPAQPRPRHSGSQSYRATPRPVSFHGGMMPQPMFYPQVIVARPPSSFTTQSPFPPPSYPPPTTSYFPPSYSHVQPPIPQPAPHTQQDPYAMPPSPFSVPPQPHLHPWPIEQHPPAQPPVTFGAPPVIDYPHSPQYGGHLLPSQDTLRRTFSERDRERPMPLRDEYFPFDEDYYRMPPPPVPPPRASSAAPTHQRPSTRYAPPPATQAPLYDDYWEEDYIREEQAQRSPRRYESQDQQRSRRPSLASRRPTVTTADRPHGVDKLEQQFARMSVEPSSAAAKQRRRMTYYGGPMPRDLEQQAEAYQAQKAATRDPATADPSTMPLTADSLKLVRRKTQTSTSDAGSRASGEGRASREGSDVKPRSATGRRGSSDVKTRNDNEGITMRFNAAHGVNLDFKGSAEGRTISLRQSKEGDGKIELSIGSKQDAREKSRRRQSYVDGPAVRELEFSRTASRMGRTTGKTETERIKERSVAPSRSRRSSKSRGALME
ncbi:MAG: hypothetical protein Q9220_006660 [cf. Caloplaca sp. 1 TL-2023]